MEQEEVLVSLGIYETLAISNGLCTRIAGKVAERVSPKAACVVPLQRRHYLFVDELGLYDVAPWIEDRPCGSEVLALSQEAEILVEVLAVDRDGYVDAIGVMLCRTHHLNEPGRSVAVSEDSLSKGSRSEIRIDGLRLRDNRQHVVNIALAGVALSAGVEVTFVAGSRPREDGVRNHMLNRAASRIVLRPDQLDPAVGAMCVSNH